MILRHMCSKKVQNMLLTNLEDSVYFMPCCKLFFWRWTGYLYFVSKTYIQSQSRRLYGRAVFKSVWFWNPRRWFYKIQTISLRKWYWVSEQANLWVFAWSFRLSGVLILNSVWMVRRLLHYGYGKTQLFLQILRTD